MLAVLAAALALTPAIPPEPGATLTISVTKPGMAGMTHTLTVRPERRPRIVTKTLS
jgi:hypothetical protein